MTSRRSSRFFRSVLLVVSLAGGVAAAGDKGVEVATASAPAGTDVRIKRALSEAIRTQVGQAGLAPKLRGYSIIPALIQLRRVVDPSQQQPSTECVVELSLQHSKRGLVAHVRGNAMSVGATQMETVYAAAHSAVERLPDTLSALQR